LVDIIVLITECIMFDEKFNKVRLSTIDIYNIDFVCYIICSRVIGQS